jgi:serine/threonine protein kinase
MEEAFFRTAIVAEEPSLSTGEVVNERFRIIDRLGAGDMSTVYKAEDIQLNRVCALKVLHPHLLVDRDSAQRFQREAIASATLDHPGIAKVFASGIWDGKPYVASEFIEGTTLASVLLHQGRISIEEAVPIFIQILDGLSHAHAHGILHRDLKPSNVMLTGADRKAKIIDFGMAKILPESGKQLQTITHTGQLMGTLAYMSPEQCMGFPSTERSDIYAMGCLMYEALVGDRAFYGASDIAIIARHMKEHPKNSNYLANDFGKVVLWALNKDAQKRPESAEKLKEAVLKPSAVQAPGGVTSVAKGRLMTLTTIAFVTALAMCFGAFSMHIGQQRNAVSVPDDRPIVFIPINDSQYHGQLSQHRHHIESDSELLQQLAAADEAFAAGEDEKVERITQPYAMPWFDITSPIRIRLMRLSADVAMRRKQYTVAGQRYRRMAEIYETYGSKNSDMVALARHRATRCFELARQEAMTGPSTTGHTDGR